MGTITLAQIWCDGMDLYKMWLYDAIEGNCDLSTSHDEDFEGIGCESTWIGLYGTTMIFLLEKWADPSWSAICGFSFGGITLIFAVL